MVQKFLLWSVLLFIIVAYTGVKAQWNGEFDSSVDFNHWQNKYKSVAIKLTTDEQVKAATDAAPVIVNQVTVGQFPQIQKDGTQQLRVDRCQSCHVGLLNPAMTAENIIKAETGQTVSTDQLGAFLSDPKNAELLRTVKTLGAHPGVSVEGEGGHDLGVIHGDKFTYGVATEKSLTDADAADYQLQKAYVKKHPFPTFGCTTCHYGSGRDLVEHVAHGDPERWLQPMLPAKFMEAACAQCHTGYDRKTLSFTYLPQLTTVARGQQLFKDYACYGCHKIEGYSKGNIGPELTTEGATVSYLTIEHQLWDPKYKVGTCVMPYFFAYREKNTDGGYADLEKVGSSKPDDHIVDMRADELKKSGQVADITNPETIESLEKHGYVPDKKLQADVDALVTFVAAQTGGNYAQSAADRMTDISTYNRSKPQEVPITVEQGKKLFETSGCFACHRVGDPNYRGRPELDPKGKGGFSGPILNGVGSRHSLDYLIAHYEHPQDYVPGSIMPEFPFSNSQRAALSLYDQSLKAPEKAARPVANTQDMPQGVLKVRGAQTADSGYMLR